MAGSRIYVDWHHPCCNPEQIHGTNFWVFRGFETLTVYLYWSAIVPLAFLFDWWGKMIESAKAIREAKKAELLQEERRRIQREMGKQGIALTPDVIVAVFDGKSEETP